MVKIFSYFPLLDEKLPQTAALLRSANLTLHPLVTQVTLHGSRSLGGHPRPDSDIDLSLLVESPNPPRIYDDLGRFFANVLEVTLDHWRSNIEPDLALVFPLRPCRLRCFQFTHYVPSLCPSGGVDCFGIYKVKKDFSGFMLNAGIQVQKMYPCLTVWRKYSQPAWCI